MEDDHNVFENGRQPQSHPNGRQLHIFANGRQSQKKIIQPKTIEIKTMVVAPLRAT